MVPPENRLITRLGQQQEKEIWERRGKGGRRVRWRITATASVQQPSLKGLYPALSVGAGSQWPGKIIILLVLVLVMFMLLVHVTGTDY